MVSGGAWWLSAASQVIRPTSAHARYLQADQRTMIHARQSLLSYASLYPYLYGPSGAGPGHLPCPDTDSQTPVAQKQLFAGDSPNPPCGSSLRAIGRLPRHVTLPGHRYAFHNEPYQRFDYSVYSHVVNNPVNRVVNPSLLTTMRSMNTVAATIEFDRSTSAIDPDRRPSVRITNANLLEAVRPAIAAWILDVVERSETSACRTLPELNLAQDVMDAPEINSTLIEKCRRLHELQTNCVKNVEVGTKAHVDAILLLLVDQLPQGDTCISADPGSSTIEQLAITRHWFYRNQWQEWVQIEFSADCTISLFACSLVYQAEQSRQRNKLTPILHPQKIVFRWQLLA